ncbi:peptide MFS transporter [Catenuloplanes niger]
MTQQTEQRRGFFGQPGALANLFGVELWERFSFYGMQGILLIYLYYSAAEGGLGIDQDTATGIVGAYGGSVYLSTILGAWLADRVLGAERTLFASAVVVMAGHVALAVLPGLAGVATGLILVAIGSGGVKATATSLVGTLYAEGDERRDAGFSLFYLGINVGALIGPLATGLLQQRAGFHWGFGLAAVGMAAGLVQYWFGRRRLPAASREVPNPLPARARPLVVVAGVVVAALVAAVIVLFTDRLSDVVVAASVLAAVAYFVVILTARTVTPVERRRVLAFIPLFVASAAFWSLYQQQFTVVTIYADQRLDRNLFGWEMPVSWVQSINPVFIILLSGVFARAVEPARRPPAGHAGQVRGRHRDHGCGVPAVPAAGRWRAGERAAARVDRHPVRLHDRGAAAVPGRPVRGHEARAARVPHPDGRVVLPVRGARHRAVRHARRLLRPGPRDRVLRHPGRGRDRARPGAGRARPDAPAPDERRPLTGTDDVRERAGPDRPHGTATARLRRRGTDPAPDPGAGPPGSRPPSARAGR